MFLSISIFPLVMSMLWFFIALLRVVVWFRVDVRPRWYNFLHFDFHIFAPSFRYDLFFFKYINETLGEKSYYIENRQNFCFLSHLPCWIITFSIMSLDKVSKKKNEYTCIRVCYYLLLLMVCVAPATNTILIIIRGDIIFREIFVKKIWILKYEKISNRTSLEI